MKTCPYCGKQSDDSLLRCASCGTELNEPEAPQKPAEDSPAVPIRVDLDQMEGAFTTRDGFSRPEWPVILRSLRPLVSPDERAAAWPGIISQWVGRWESELGADYWQISSGFFTLVSNDDGDAAERTLQSANWMARTLRATLGPIAWEGCPQIVLVQITDSSLAARFNAAVSLDEDSNPLLPAALAQAPAWMLLSESEETTRRGEIENWLVWSCLAHLPLPNWLYMGVRTQLIHALAAARMQQAGRLHDPELIPNHRRFWFEDTIQSFWAGTVPQEYVEYGDLYYELCNLVVYHLSEKAPRLTEFLRLAGREDAGQAAARILLKLDLGDIAAMFLGPGQWAPDPLAIAECWERVRKSASDDTPE